MPNRARKPLGVPRTDKAKKTFTLSREAVHFLESEKEKRGSESTSLVLEDLIREYRQRAGTKNIDAVISAYYDSLPDEDLEEDKRWGEFAETQFPVD